eukprot:TRINITY_DN5075_c0_g1_i3.p2 TRINITY_DN5075_c0_g1~~TRINITY_DN5075_c0_g1_i3.p2  ORF type:complete len:515 (+),score=106.42 TRINITY_DN5075_c0_g1_i3:179-1546(+)
MTLWARAIDGLIYLRPSTTRIRDLIETYLQSFSDLVATIEKQIKQGVKPHEDEFNLRPLIAIALSKNKYVQLAKPIDLLRQLASASDFIGQQAQKNIPYVERISFVRRLTITDLSSEMLESFFDAGFSRNEIVEHTPELFDLFMWLFAPSQHMAQQLTEVNDLTREAAALRLNTVLIKENPKVFFTNYREISVGEYACVYMCQSKRKGVPIALKVIKDFTKHEQLVRKEIAILKEYHHDNTARLLDCYLWKNEVWMILEFTNGGLLSDMFTVQGSLSEPEIAYIIREVLKALVYLHKKKVMHRDLRAESILLLPDGQVWITDLGFDDKLMLPADEQIVVNRRYYMAPEMIRQEPYGCKVDIWSLGCVAFQMAESNPHRDLTLFKSAFLTISQGPPKFTATNLSNRFRDFVDKCLQSDPYRRPSAEQLLSHPFLEFACSKERMVELVKASFWFGTK